MSLKLEEAQHVLEAALSIAGERGVKVAVAVVDNRGTLVAAARIDGTPPYGPDVALGKAMASAIWQRKSSDLVDSEGVSSPRLTISNLHGGRLVYSPGAVPLIRDGTTLGAIGVGGVVGSVSEEIAIRAATGIGN